jgi:acyl-CoA thioester hydrolase
MGLSVLKVKVNFFDTDAMAVVHHANYFKWFEMARIEFLREAGITLNALMEDNILFPITDVSCKYRSSARFDDIVRIETTAEELTKVKMAFSYKAYRDSDNTLLAEGFTQNLFTDARSGRIIKIPAAYYEKLKAKQAE